MNHKRATQGYLHIECPKCGKAKSFSVYHDIDTYDCDCGNKVPLDDLVGVMMTCPKCSKRHHFQTNIRDPHFQLGCVKCGSETTVWWDGRRQEYHPN